MFGFQRVGDLIWAAADQRARGFLVGATSGRTTLAGEGLQHQDGSSHLVAATIPNCVAYDPAHAYEVAVIVQDGMRRMLEEGEDVFYYLTVTNENNPQPPIPEGAREGILRGMHRIGTVDAPQARLLAAGPIVKEALAAAELLRERFGIAAEVWSVTSFSELSRQAIAVERDNRWRDEQEMPYVTQQLQGGIPVIAASDYVKAVADSIRAWVPAPYVTLGTDGFGRSDTRAALRDHFEVSAAWIAFATIEKLRTTAEERRAAAAALGITSS
jgi:pyruvate dehydrogenase E1 component